MWRYFPFPGLRHDAKSAAASKSPKMARAQQQRIKKCLEQGKFTDCTFLVGKEGEELQEVHAVKAIMMMTSPFFEDILGHLMDENWAPGKSVNIPCVSAETFKQVVEFAHLGTVQDVKLDDVYQLLLAANTFSYDNLKSHCSELLGKMIKADTVWPAVDKVLGDDFLQNIASQSLEFLRKNTAACLLDPSFLQATERSIIFLLQQGSLHLRSERQLVQSCIKWAQQQSNPTFALRKLLPHMRLLTMATKDVALCFHSTLQSSELGVVVKYIATGLKPGDDFPLHICRITERRKFTMVTQTMTPVVKTPLIWAQGQIGAGQSSFTVDMRLL